MLDKQIEKLRNDIQHIVKNSNIDLEELNKTMQEKMLVQN